MPRPPHSRPSLAPPFVALAALVVGACGGGPVAELTATPASVELPYGGMAPIELRFALRREIDGDPFVFLHVLDAEGEIVLTRDHPFPAPWSPGETVLDPVHLYHSALALPFVTGDYTVTVGVYDAGGGERWPLAAGAAVARREYAVARVRVPAERRTPVVGFSGGWEEPLAGESRQVRASRWLSGEGTIELTRAPGPGTLWLDLRVPEPGPTLRLLPAADATGPAVRLTTDCGGASADLHGTGHHEVALPITSPTPDAPCRVTLTPDFHLLDPTTLRQTALELRQVGWVGE